jgi:hypothetical protein
MPMSAKLSCIKHLCPGTGGQLDCDVTRGVHHLGVGNRMAYKHIAVEQLRRV